MSLSLVGVLVSTLTSAAPSQAQVEASTHAFHQKRLERLKRDDGWLTLVGLYWLQEGDNAAGSAPHSALELPASAPAHVGNFHLEKGAVTFVPAPGVTVTDQGKPFTGGKLKGDHEEGTDELKFGSFTLFVIERQGRFGVRLRDREAPLRKTFGEIPTFSASARWVVSAHLEKSATPKKLSVPTVLGTVEESDSPGTLVFQLDGKEYRLDPVMEEGTLFIIFGDETNRVESYGAGRFLYAKAPDATGNVVLDFNQAVNPPCAFTSFATCPLPPRQNKLKLRVDAGEKRPPGH